jgi:hypothetical protein
VEKTMIESLILAAMTELYHPKHQQVSYLRETIEEAERRYEELAADIAEVAFDENEPPLFDGPAGREATALLLTAVAWHESGFRKDVETCHGPLAKGDDGRSIGLFQIMRGSNRQGYSAKQICSDRKLQVRLGLHVLRRAKERCGGAPIVWLQAYGAGRCHLAHRSARNKCAAFERIGKKHFEGLSCKSTGPVSFIEKPKTT